MSSDSNHDEDGSVFLHRSRFVFEAKIILVILVVVVVIVAPVVLCHIYKRRQYRRRRRETANANVEPGPRSGLDASVIASIPSFVFKKGGKLTTECAVCLIGLDEGEIVKTLPDCKHTFHAECVNKWLASNSTCPTCRAEAEPSFVSISLEPNVALALPP